MTPDELLDHTPIRNGKHRSKTASQIAEIDPAYVVYMYETWNPKPCSALLYNACLDEVHEERNQRRVSKDQDE